MKREVDLHNMSVIEARRYLKMYLNNLPKEVDEIDVIHGFHNGTNLQTFVRKDFGNKRIDRKILGLNNGVTTFMIKK
jgi:hypothetical protein